MRLLLFFVFAIAFNSCLFAQVSQLGYYITKDGIRYNGVTIENPDYADACERVMISTSVDSGKYFYPKDIAAYGTNYGYKYISSIVMIDGDTVPVFLKELIKDNDILLYEYEGKKGRIFFTIDKATGMYEPIEDGGVAYRNLLRQRAADCEVLQELDKLPLKMTESSLLSLYESYTKCSVNDYPGLKWGVTVNIGYSFFNFEDENRFDISNKPYAMPGLFLEVPIDRRISLRAELYYFYTKATSKQWSVDLNMHSFSYKRHSLVLPLLFKYRFSNIQGNVLPYIEFGATMDFKLSGDMNVEEEGQSALIRTFSGANFAVGPEFGVGLEHTIKNDCVLYYGVRTGYYFGAASTDKREFRSNISINCGIAF